METIARIRRERFIKGKTIKEIAHDLKVSRNIVRKVLRSGQISFEYERLVPLLYAVQRRAISHSYGIVGIRCGSDSLGGRHGRYNSTRTP